MACAHASLGLVGRRSGSSPTDSPSDSTTGWASSRLQARVGSAAGSTTAPDYPCLSKAATMSGPMPPWFVTACGQHRPRALARDLAHPVAAGIAPIAECRARPVGAESLEYLGSSSLGVAQERRCSLPTPHAALRAVVSRDWSQVIGPVAPPSSRLGSVRRGVPVPIHRCQWRNGRRY
jgi:hypothetical protein